MPAEERTFTAKNGDEFTFLFDMDGLIAVENCANRDNEANANLAEIFQGAAKMRRGYLTALIYGGLKAHHPDITRAQAWDLTESDGTALGAALWPAFLSAMPESKGNPRKAGSGTGTRSSPPGSKKDSQKSGSGSRRQGATQSS